MNLIHPAFFMTFTYMQTSQQKIKTLLPFQLVKYLPGLILTLLSMALRFKALCQTNFANGWDSYFYLVQLKTWIEEGQMHSPDFSLVYPIMRGMYWLAGDYILVFKLSAALFAGLATFAIFHVAKRWSGNMYLALLVGSISLFSPHLTYFAAQYPKNLLGVSMLFFFLASLKEKLDYRSLLWLVLCFFGHRLTFAVAIIFGVSWMVFKHLTFRKIALLLGSGLLLFALSLVLPGLPNLSDFHRFEGLIGSGFQFASYSFIQDFGTQDRISMFWLIEIILASSIYFISIPFLLKSEKRLLAITFFGVSSLLLFPFLKWDFTGMAYRFFLLYILIAPLFLALLLKTEDQPKYKLGLLFLSLLLMLGSIFSWRSYQPKKHDAAYAKYAQLTDNAMKHLNPSSSELVIAHNALAEYFTFHTNIDAMPWNPEYKIDSLALNRIATDIRQREMAYYLSEKEMQKVYKIGIRYFLIPEYLWQKILTSAKEQGDDFLLEKLNTWRNPHRVRPAFLKKNREEKE